MSISSLEKAFDVQRTVAEGLMGSLTNSQLQSPPATAISSQFENIKDTVELSPEALNAYAGQNPDK